MRWMQPGSVRRSVEYPAQLDTDALENHDPGTNTEVLSPPVTQ